MSEPSPAAGQVQETAELQGTHPTSPSATIAPSPGFDNLSAPNEPRPSYPIEDPAQLAFSEAEITDLSALQQARQHWKLKDGKALASELSQPDADALAADHLALAAKALDEGNPTLTLNICTHVYRLGTTTNPALFQLASDAFLRLQRFQEAENCIFQAILLGDDSPGLYNNLINLHLMRHDVVMAAFYLTKLHELDPLNPLIPRLRDMVQKSTSTNGRSKFRFLDLLSYSEVTPT